MTASISQKKCRLNWLDLVRARSNLLSMGDLTLTRSSSHIPSMRRTAEIRSWRYIWRTRTGQFVCFSSRLCHFASFWILLEHAMGKKKKKDNQGIELPVICVLAISHTHWCNVFFVVLSSYGDERAFKHSGCLKGKTLSMMNSPAWSDKSQRQHLCF